MSSFSRQLAAGPISGLTGEPISDDPAQIRLQRVIRSSWWKLDLCLLSVAMLATVFTPPLLQHQYGAAHVLSLRVSLVNFVLAAVCLAMWRLSILVTMLHPSYSVVSLSRVVLQATLQITCCTGVAGLFFLARHPERAILAAVSLFGLLSFALHLVGRLVVVFCALWFWPRLRRPRQVVIVGSGWRAQCAAIDLRTHPRWRYGVLGFIDSEPLCSPEEYLGPMESLEPLLMRESVDEVIITLPVRSKYNDIQSAIATCERVGVQSGYSMDLFTTEVTKSRSIEKNGGSSVVLHMVHQDHRQLFKRLLDVIGAVSGLLLLSPILIVAAVAIKLTSKGPVIFCQQRFGLNRRTFRMYKFRSMVVDAEQQQQAFEHLNEVRGPTFKIRDDPRVTRVGDLLRKTSVDELPQLLNVIRGDMSLVGPRPLPMRDVNRFPKAWLMCRFSVKPGLTGLWQVSGRSNTTFANWIQLDLEYIDRWTFLLDLQILVRTLPAVLRREGAV